ncbi:MAG: Ppx/GppA family phosphatase [Clostridiales bacterium]|nr:Ppx/GppA family phosphatase [Clostridiales bacterium]MCF8023134.1 Ppx/GppA family phosphatase [Clostridiales bacterium]
MSKNVGIIDLGSNSVRLNLMQIKHNGAYRFLDDIKETVKLAEGMGPEKKIKQEPMNRAVKAVKLFKRFCQANEVENTIGVATAAVRTAVNNKQILDILYKETGIHFRVLSEMEEARYGYYGVINSMSVSNGIIVDIGGGSTELVLCRNRKMVEYVSLPFGAITLTEKYISSPWIKDGEIKRLENYIYNKLTEITWLKNANKLNIVGIGGTIRNIARVHKNKINYSVDLIHNYFLSYNQAKRIYSSFQNVSADERKSFAGLSKDRVDIIVGGSAMAIILMKYLESPGVVVSGFGLREGLFYEYMFSNRKSIVLNDVTERSVQNMMLLYNVRKSHVEHVAKLSLSLFDQLAPLHGHDTWERNLLRKASLLHDLGTVVSYYNCHKHAMYILLNTRINGLTHREQVLIAHIVAYSGKINLKENFKKYADVFVLKDNKLVRKLGILLRMAICLDRSEAGIVNDIECIIKEKEVEIYNIGTQNSELEIRELHKKVTNFNKVYGKRFKFITKEGI